MSERNLTDILEIQALLARYPFASDAGSFRELASLFAPEGTFRTPFGSAVGPEAIVRHLESLAGAGSTPSRPAIVRHHVTSQRVVILDDSRAEAASYFLVLTDSGVDHWGRYDDRLVRVEAGWRIAERTVTVEGFGPESYYRSVERG